mmetsp:Transcript_20832/g.43486  ORF Transcript_20832/g.43486 Transcript_20832/m.43486 type:complete len:123 (+) Transcript_20832:1237-1605(+)
MAGAFRSFATAVEVKAVALSSVDPLLMNCPTEDSSLAPRASIRDVPPLPSKVNTSGVAIEPSSRLQREARFFLLSLDILESLLMKLTDDMLLKSLCLLSLLAMRCLVCFEPAVIGGDWPDEV